MFFLFAERMKCSDPYRTKNHGTFLQTGEFGRKLSGDVFVPSPFPQNFSAGEVRRLKKIATFEDSHFDIYFSMGLKPPTRKIPLDFTQMHRTTVILTDE